jgi:hypothetical protein
VKKEQCSLSIYRCISDHLKLIAVHTVAEDTMYQFTDGSVII